MYVGSKYKNLMHCTVGDIFFYFSSTLGYLGYGLLNAEIKDIEVYDGIVVDQWVHVH